MAERLAGKRILITGAGGKMGSDIARAFSAEGAELVLSTRTAAKLEPLATELRQSGANVATVTADLTIDKEAVNLAYEAWDAFGGIDVVLLSSQPPEPCQGELLVLSDAVLEEQQKAIAWGPLRMLRHLVPKMIEARRGGNIITLTSSTGFDEPVTGFGAYGIAKGTLWVMTRYMAAEWGKYGIRANAFQPGYIATGGDEHAASRQEQLTANGWLKRTALGRVGRNHECFGALIYLASDESSYTSGQCLVVNGGRF